ncbi:HesA/MoeB/ThiF family protein [Frigidibacter sp. MR17.14]|uniref:HesA/MoeB/ThiF family protein n=1 Tax=Frigidibacter sp. MR17.14 TaxID=3126509 RepID=UPI00301300AC
MSRYARQIAVEGFGVAGQQALRGAHALVVGAGGLAAPVLQYLVGAGFGRIRLVDPDVVDRSNLHRQTLFTESDIGRPKVAAAAARMAALNPETAIESLRAALTPATAARLAEGVTMVLDCADSFAVSYILSDLCLAAGLPFLSASVVGRDGYAGGFCAGAPSLRAVFPDLPQRMGSCAVNGVLGPVVGVIGSLQAQMALAIATGDRTPLGRIVTFDGAGFRAGGFRFDRAPEPDHAPRFIDAGALDGRDFLVDLRAEDEGPLAHPTARRLTVADFDAPPLPAPGQRAVLICRSGLRSWQAAEKLSAQWPGEIALVALGDHSQGETR